jgi:glycosyltransferase involved in cell wall biosynthesis
MYGAESVIVSLCKWFSAERHRCAVGVFLNRSNPIPELHRICEQQGIESHLIQANGRLDTTAIKGIRKLACSTSFDVVHSHGYKADVLVYLALRRTILPYVATCHSWLDDDLKARVYGYLDRRILSRYSRIAAVSAEVERRLQCAGIQRERIELIGNGINVQSFELGEHRNPDKCDRQPDLAVGFVGRLSYEKGPDVFIRAARNVLQQHNRVQFQLAGVGPERSSLEQLVRDLGVEDKIRFLGHVRDMPALYREFDIMVSSSRREGSPVAVLEGMACGLPVIATSVGDVPKMIDHGHTGILVPPEDPGQLSQAILELLRNPPGRQQLGQSAKMCVKERFSAERMGSDYLEFYRRAVRGDA